VKLIASPLISDAKAVAVIVWFVNGLAGLREIEETCGGLFEMVLESLPLSPSPIPSFGVTAQDTMSPVANPPLRLSVMDILGTPFTAQA
jgi:hypothetical protein